MKKNVIKLLGVGAVTFLITTNCIFIDQTIGLTDAVESLKEQNKNVIENCEKLEQKNKKLEKELENLKKNRWIYKGDYEVTGYCNCKKCNDQYAYGPTKSGKMPVEGRTIAVDTSIIPLGTEVVIDGHAYTAEDIGGAIKGNKIDVYFDNHEDAKKFGRQKKEVFI